MQIFIKHQQHTAEIILKKLPAILFAFKFFIVSLQTETFSGNFSTLSSVKVFQNG